ncbi:transposase [bacterium]|nr:transposase [bacterium]
MGEGPKAPLRVDFDRSIKLEFHGAQVTSDADLLQHREFTFRSYQPP